MQALVLESKRADLQLRDLDDPAPGRGEVLVELRAAALNRRDLWIQMGKYPGIALPCVLGSDGAGVIAACGPGVDPGRVGEAVVIDPGIGWGERAAAQDPRYRILGMPDDGTFAERVSVAASAAHPRPAQLDWRTAAALPLGGLTAYRACFSRGELRAGERVLITGVGGGVASCALLFARAAGARVAVSSSSAAKRAHGQELGAAAAYDYHDPEWSRQAASDFGGFELIVDGAGGPGYEQLMDLAAPGGRIVSYGATAGRPESIDLHRHFWKQLNLLGSTMGSPDDFARMLALVERCALQPPVDRSYPLAQGNDAFARMREGEQFGKLVLDIAS